MRQVQIVRCAHNLGIVLTTSLCVCVCVCLLSTLFGLVSFRSSAKLQDYKLDLKKKCQKNNNCMSFLKNPFFGLSELAIPKNELL